ncbi:MAG: hypothetical protein KC645_10220, partial [Gemmatimonadetes bacterium]|nr:hypothetical protein [Gemmatimonadota bacterium]
AVAHAPAPPLACTRTWSPGPGPSITDYDWHVAGHWIPAGIPGSTDIVCVLSGLAIAADTVVVRALEVGASGELAAHSLLEVSDTAIVRGHVTGYSGSRLAAGGVVNEGTVTLLGGTVDGDLENHGTVLLDPTGIVQWTGRRIRLHDGAVTSTAPLAPSTATVSAEEVEWHGGDVDLQVTFSTRVMRLAAPDLDGALSLQRADTLYGDIGSGVRLFLGVKGALGGSTVIRRSRGAPAAPVTNHGSLRTTDPTLRPLSLDLPPSFQNQALVSFETPTTLIGGRLVNHSFTVVEADLTVESGLVNHAVVDIDAPARVTMASGSILDVRNQSFVLGPVTLAAATLVGTGVLDSVVATAATIAPGDAGSPFGTLSFRAGLDLDALSRLDLQVRDPAVGPSDRLYLFGNVLAPAPLGLDGDLRVTAVGGFQGGRCGDRIPLIAGIAAISGQFQTVTLPATGAQRGWRISRAGYGLDLVGYRPGTRVSVEPAALTVEEGGPPVSYSVCLGSVAPMAAVEVAPASVAGEVGASPVATFDPADWMLPRTVEVTAIDDADVEGTHTDTLSHTLTTTDPTYAGSAVARVPVTILDDDQASDLTLTKLLQEDNQFVGDTMSTTFGVANDGPSAATRVQITSPPLVGLELVDATGATCLLDATGGLDCRVGVVDVGAQVDVVIRFRGAVVGLHTNTLTVVGAQPDPDGADNSVVYTQRVN